MSCTSSSGREVLSKKTLGATGLTGPLLEFPDPISLKPPSRPAFPKTTSRSIVYVPMRATTVRFSDDLWALLEAEASEQGISAAQFVRDATIMRLGILSARRDDPAAGLTLEALAAGALAVRPASNGAQRLAELPPGSAGLAAGSRLRPPRRARRPRPARSGGPDLAGGRGPAVLQELRRPRRAVGDGPRDAAVA